MTTEQITRDQIVKMLEAAGFRFVPQSRRFTLRCSRPSDWQVGSLYVSKNRLVASGCYKNLEHVIPCSGSDHRGYPMWERQPMSDLLEHLVVSGKLTPTKK